MRTAIGRSVATCAGVAIAVTFPGLISAQVPTRSSEPRLVVPTTATPVPSQPTAAPAPDATAPTAAASPDTTPPGTPAGAPVTQVTGGASGVTNLGGGGTPATSSSAQAATAATRSYAAGKFYFELGLAGGPAGTYARSIEGGDPVADVAVHEMRPGSVAISVTNVKFTDIVAEVPVTDFTDLINQNLEGKYSTVNGRLVAVNFNYQAQSQVGFQDALLTEVEFPALDASSKEQGFLKLHLATQKVREEAPGSVPAGSSFGSKQQPWLKSNFSLTVSGLEKETKRVSRIEPFSLIWKTAPDEVGAASLSTKSPVSASGSRLTITFSAADAPGWIAWRDDFLINGNNGQTAEKSLALTLMGADWKTPLLVLNGTGVGLITLRRLPTPAASDAMVKYQAELYVEQWSVGKGSKGS